MGWWSHAKPTPDYCWIRRWWRQLRRSARGGYNGIWVRMSYLSYINTFQWGIYLPRLSLTQSVPAQSTYFDVHTAPSTHPHHCATTAPSHRRALAVPAPVTKFLSLSLSLSLSACIDISLGIAVDSIHHFAPPCPTRYVAGVGMGGSNSAGGPGLAIITYSSRVVV